MKKLIEKLFLACLVCLVLSTSVFAQTTDAAGFTVRAILPENQIDSNNNYFDLRMKPGATQDIQIEVLNTTDKAIVLDVMLRAASTNRNGIIEYLVENEPDETMLFPFNTIANAPAEVRLGPGEQQQVTVGIHMPQEQFDGEILGGIAITKRSDAERAPGIGINNLFSYVIGVRLTETDKEISPDFDLKSVQESLVNYRVAVVANIRNLEPVIVRDAKASAQVYKDGGSTPLFSVDRPGVDFAPDSVFPLPVEWEGQRLEPGNYRISVQLDHEGEVWNWDHDFVISSSQAREINDAAVSQAPSPFPRNNFMIIFVFLLMLILIISAFYLGRKSRRLHSDE